MPTLDVNDAFDPSFLDTIFVDRIIQTVSAAGRVVRSKQRYTVQAVVTPSSPNDLQRVPEEAYMNKAITIYSPVFRLQGPTRDPVTGNDTDADEVTWHGSTFVVTSNDDFAGFGRGYTSYIAVSINAIDAPIPTPMGSA